MGGRWVAVAALLVIWNVLFDWQVRQAGDRFVTDQLQRHARGDPPVLIADVMTPAVRRAARIAWVGVGVGAALMWRRLRRKGRRPRVRM